jgi:DNA polymerase elongation subunit (family B)
MKFMLYDLQECATETHSNLIRMYGMGSNGELVEALVTGTPHALYASVDQLPDLNPLSLRARLNKDLLRKPSPCRRTACETCERNEPSLVLPYGVCNEPCVSRRRLDTEAVIDVQIVSRRGFEVYEEHARPFYHIVLRGAYYASSAKHWLEARGADAYEVCTNAVESFLRLKDARAFEWYECPDDATVVHFDQVRVCAFEGKAPHLRHLVFDIETIALKYNNIDSESAEYPLGCLVCSHAPKQYVAYMLGEEVEGYEEPEEGATTEIKYYADELQMLKAFRDEQLAHTQIVSGYNSDAFDLKYMFTRGRRLGDAKFNKMQDGRETWLKVEFNRGREVVKVLCPGLIPMDYQKLVMGDTQMKPRNFKLETVCEDLGLPKKGDVDYKEIFEHFHGSPAKRGKLLSYCAKDVYLAKEVGNKMGAYTKLEAKCLVKRILPRDELYRGRGYGTTRLVKSKIQNEFLMLCPKDEKTAKGRKRRAIHPPFLEIKGYEEHFAKFMRMDDEDDEDSDDEGEEGAVKKKYSGGYVRVPVPGLYTGDRVFTLDFKSLYPSIIRDKNICRSTQLKSPDDLPEHQRWVSLLGFAFATHREGVMPRIMRELVDARNAEKAKMKLTKDKTELARLKALETEIKVAANSSYGIMGARTSELVLMSAAASICSDGAALAKACGDAIVAKFAEEFGLKIIYGDTDSMMIFVEKSSGKDQTLEWGLRVQNFINNDSGLLGDSLEMALEDVGNIYLRNKKKHYCKYVMTVNGDKLDAPKLKISGMANRNKSEYALECQKAILECAVVRGEDPTQMFKEMLRKVAAGEVDPELLTSSSSVNKPLDQYANEQHVVAARQMVSAGMLVRPGDRIEYYHCLLLGSSTGERALGVVAAPFVKQYDLDWAAYFEKTVKSLDFARDFIKDFDHITSRHRFQFKRGTYRAPPEYVKPIEKKAAAPKKRPAVASGAMDAFVTKNKKGKSAVDFNDILGDI